mmetsp:Transcript_613/g.1584  ORF Transcript_613/g.1584 Transcript_613/m.1584 type:complete len:254 (-) Transcript_613:360-1121(-)
MDLKNFQPLCLIRFRNFNLTVQPSGTQQCGVQNIRPIRRHDHLDLSLIFKPVHLVQKFHEGTLNFTVGTGTLTETATTDRIDLIHEDDTRFMVSCETEHLTDDPSRFTDVLVDDCRRHDFQKRRIDVTSKGTSKQRLPCSGRSVQQHTLRCLDSYPDEQFRVGEWEFNDLPEFTDLFIQPTDITKRHTTLLLTGLHVEHRRVDLTGQDAHDRQRRHVECDTCARLEAVMAQPTPTPYDIPRPTRRLDDEPFGI